MRSWPWLGVAAVASASVFALAFRGPPERMPGAPAQALFGLMQPSLLALPALGDDKPDAGQSPAVSAPRTGSPDVEQSAYRKQRISPRSSAWRFEHATSLASVRAVFEHMKASARHSAAEVAQLVEALDYCERSWRPLRNALASERVRLEHGEGASLDLDAATGAVAQGDPVCEDIPDEIYREQDDWLSEAAAAGDEKAQFLYASGRLHLWRDQINLMRWPEEVLVYKERARGYLEALARRGHEDSLLALADSYDSGTLTDMNAELAFVYRYAVTRAQGDPDADARARSLLQGLPPERREESLRLATSLYRDCCAPR